MIGWLGVVFSLTRFRHLFSPCSTCSFGGRWLAGPSSGRSTPTSPTAPAAAWWPSTTSATTRRQTQPAAGTQPIGGVLRSVVENGLPVLLVGCDTQHRPGLPWLRPRSQRTLVDNKTTRCPVSPRHCASLPGLPRAARSRREPRSCLPMTRPTPPGSRPTPALR